MTRILLAALGLCVIALGWMGWAYEAQRGDLAAQAAETARLTRELDTAAQRLAQAEFARTTAEAEAERFQQKANEYDDLRKTMEGVDDAPLPPWLREYIRRLFATAGGPH